MEMAFDVNYLAVLVAAIASMAFGFFWYSPAGFGKQWIKLSGMTKKQLDSAKKKGMGKSMTLGFIAQLVMAYVLAVFLGYTNSTTWMAGIVVAFWLWLGFIATVSLGSVLWDNKPFTLYLLNVAHWLIAVGIMGAILGAWV
jgi:hypothetical protein